MHFKYFKNQAVVGDIKKCVDGSNVSQEVRKEILQSVESYEQWHVEDMIEPVGHFLVPIFLC